MTAPHTSSSGPSAAREPNHDDSIPWWRRPWVFLSALFLMDQPPRLDSTALAVLQRAHTLRIHRRHFRTTEAHLASALTDAPECLHWFRRCAVDKETLRQTAELRMSALSTVALPPQSENRDEVVQWLIKRAYQHALFRGRREAGSADLVWSCTNAPAPSPAPAPAAPAPPAAAPAPPAGAWRITLHDDDVTEMDFVVDLLERTCGLTNLAATAVMQGVHNHSSCVVMAFDHKEEAEAHLANMIEVVAAEGAPLRITLDAAG